MDVSKQESCEEIILLSSYQTEEKPYEDYSNKIYMDFNATTPLELTVVESISKCLMQNWSNPSSQYSKGKEARHLINDARKHIATMINATSINDIIFTSGGTEANNIVFHSALREFNMLAGKNPNLINQLPHFIISNVEHDSVKLIAENYAKENLAEITYVQVNEHCQVTVADVLDAIKDNTILISIMLANNETGVVQPVREIISRINKLGFGRSTRNKGQRWCPLYVHTDAAQAIGKIKVDVDELQVDYMTIVGHKFYGPKIGALYARNCTRQAYEPELVTDSVPQPNMNVAPVHRIFHGAQQENGLRAGTENTPMIVGLGKAAQLVSRNIDYYSFHMKEMRDYLENCLQLQFGAENVRFNGRSSKCDRLPNTCNVSFLTSDKCKGYLILQRARLVEASTGACCHSSNLQASNILLAMKVGNKVASNAIRLSVGRETTKSQIDLVVQDLKQALHQVLI